MSDLTTPTPEEQGQPAVEKRKRKGLTMGDYAIIGALLIVAAVIGVALTDNDQKPVDGRAPDFAFTTFDGQEMTLRDLRGNVVVLNFWASWCAPCAAEAPDLQEAWEYYADDNVRFLGIAYADNGPRSLEFIDDFGLTYLNAPDLGTRISEMYGISGVPETFIIDANGDVAQFIYAGVTYDQLRAAVDPLLQEG